LEHVRSLYGRCNPIDMVDPLFERSIRDELVELLRHWLARLRVERVNGNVPSDTMAHMLSWAIFGAAVEWSKGRDHIGVEEMTDRVVAVLTEGMLGTTSQSEDELQSV
jgi:hypothetical protein